MYDKICVCLGSIAGQCATLVRQDIKSYFKENQKNFKAYLLKTRNVSERRTTDYINSISNHLTDKIYSTKDLKAFLNETYTDALSKALKNIFNFMEYEEEETFNGQTLDAWRKSIKIRPSNVREVYISDKEVKEAYKHIDNKLLYKILVFSGMRLSQVVRGLPDIDKAVVFDKFFRIPLGNASQGHKKGFWLYLPIKLKKDIENNNNFSYNPKALSYKRVNANAIRKWNLNKLLELDVPMDVINFIQGRSATNVGSLHYMDSTRAADREYEKIVNRYMI